jgi:tRNA1(Val) A37 N6-methylase TrmN6
MVTVDSFLDGRLHLQQPRTGYRVNVDSVHLAHFAARSRANHICDLGAGVGAVGLMVHTLVPARKLTFVERDTHMLDCLRVNTAGTTATVLDADVASLDVTIEADLVVMNPPYFTHGRKPSAAKRDARFGPLQPFAMAARRTLRKRGRVAMVYPVADLVAALEQLRAAGLEPKELQFVHAKLGVPARVALVLAKPAKPGGLAVLPPRYDATL